MCERPKIHAFLGAPRPSAGAARRERPPHRRRVRLSWRRGRLVPATDEDDDGTREDERSHEEAPDPTSRRSAGSPPALEARRVSPLCRGWPLPEPRLSLLSRYLSTWTLSQALFLRGLQSAGCADKTPAEQARTSAAPERSGPAARSPQGSDKLLGASGRSPQGSGELLAPVTRSPQGSDDLFGASGRSSEADALSGVTRCSPEGSFVSFDAARRVERGGVVLEATSHGVLCSQEANRPESSPAFKRARRCQAAEEGGADPFAAPTTLLAQCTEAEARYRVLVAVLHPCQLKEIKVKRGASEGCLVPLASVLVTDQSGVDVTVLLWRRAAFWAAAVRAGDMVLITGLELREDTWTGEKMLQSTFSSKLLNLGHVSAPAHPTGAQRVDAGAVSSLCQFLRERRPMLLSLPSHPPQDVKRLPYAPLWPRRVNTLIHALLRITHAYVSAEWRAEAESWRRSALERHAVAGVEGAGGQKGALLLWGSALDWLPRFRKQPDAVWDIRFLLVREGCDPDHPELHSTPWSAARQVDAADGRLSLFLRAPGGDVEMDLDTLLSQQYSGDALLRVRAVSFRFQTSRHAALDGSTPRAAILAALSGDVTYSGCGRCGAELDADANGIYAPCYPCLPAGAVRRYYRPAVLTVRGRGSGQACLQVPAVAVQKIVDVPADRLPRSAGPGVTHVLLAAERLGTLLGLPGKELVVRVRSLFLCDENSAPISRELTLLDLRFLSDA